MYLLIIRDMEIAYKDFFFCVVGCCVISVVIIRVWSSSTSSNWSI